MRGTYMSMRVQNSSLVTRSVTELQPWVCVPKVKVPSESMTVRYPVWIALSRTLRIDERAARKTWGQDICIRVGTVKDVPKDANQVLGEGREMESEGVGGWDTSPIVEAVTPMSVDADITEC